MNYRKSVLKRLESIQMVVAIRDVVSFFEILCLLSVMCETIVVMVS